MSIQVTNVEVEALMEWHTGQEQEAANKQEYSEADYHKKRVEELQEMLQADECLRAEIRRMEQQREESKAA